MLGPSAPGPDPASRSWFASHCCTYRVKVGRKPEDQWNPDLRKLSPAEPMSQWRQNRKDNLKTPRPPWLPLSASLPACGALSPSPALQIPIPGILGQGQDTAEQGASTSRQPPAKRELPGSPVPEEKLVYSTVFWKLKPGPHSRIWPVGWEKSDLKEGTGTSWVWGCRGPGSG